MVSGKQQKAPSGASLIERMQKLGLTYRKTAELLQSDHSYLWLILHGKRAHPGYAYRRRVDALLTHLEAGAAEGAGAAGAARAAEGGEEVGPRGHAPEELERAKCTGFSREQSNPSEQSKFAEQSKSAERSNSRKACGAGKCLPGEAES